MPLEIQKKTYHMLGFGSRTRGLLLEFCPFCRKPVPYTHPLSLIKCLFVRHRDLYKRPV